MKHLVVIGGGLSDQPIVERDNQTPLQLADVPNLDRMVQTGRGGAYNPIPEPLPAGPEASFPGLLGYDPEEHPTSAGHLMAQALGVPVGEDEIPLCCDFIILQSSHNDMILKDFTADRLSRDDSEMLIAALQESIVSDGVRFHSGGGPNNLMVMKTAPFPDRLEPPMELIGEGIRKHIQQDKAYRDLVHLMNEAQIILHNHPLNRRRRSESRDPVNSVWFWGNRRGATGASTLPAFESLFGRTGAVITDSPLLRGMARAAGMEVPEPADGSYGSRVEATLQALDRHDIVYTHAEAGETVSLQGMIDDKIAAIEDFDEQLVGPLLQAVELRGNVKMLVTENHMSSVDLMRYKKTAVPYALYPASGGAVANEAVFTEEAGEQWRRAGCQRPRPDPNFF